jgi:linoleoyl-CoA desaturase
MKTITAEPIRTEKIVFKTDAPVFPELRKRIRNYFDATSLEQTGNISLLIKAGFFITTYIAAYVFVMLHPPAWVALLACLYMGWAAAGIGFNLMHDGSHGSFSDNEFLNKLAAYSINFLGGDAVLWKNKHNMIHHTYTNIEGFDQDIAQMPVFRSNIHQKKRSFHKFQHLYCLPVYALSSMLWVFLLDYIKYFTGKVGSIPIAHMSVTDHIVFWITKISYLVLYLVVPVIIWGPLYTAIGFFAYHAVLGIMLSIVFQLAHMVEEAEFTGAHFDSNVIEEEWAIHQLKTTANFSTNSKFMSWYTGGLNFQVEHHLFPKVSHVHYPALNKIVKEFCKEKDLCYNEFKTFGGAFLSHIAHLKTTGRAE